MAVSIGTLAYKIVADTSGLTRGLVLTRKELTATKAIVEETKPSAVRYQQTMEGLGRILAKGAINHEQYTSAVRKIRLEKLAAIPIIGKYVSGIASISSPLLALTAATAAAAGAFRWFLREAESVDARLKSARAIGMTTKDMGSLGYAVGRLAEVDASAFSGSIIKMSRAISDASRDSKKAQDFLLLGLDPKRLMAGGSANAFREIADAISKLRNPMDQVSMALAIFGKGAGDMVPALAAGGREIGDLEARFRSLRGVMPDSAADMERAADAAKDLEISWSSLKRRIAMEMAPRLSRGLKEASDLVASNGMVGAFAGIHAFLRNLDADTGMPELVGLNPAVAERRKRSLLAVQETIRQRQDAAKMAAKTQADMAKQQAEMRRGLMSEAATIHDRNLTPFEKYRAGLAEANKLLRVGALSALDYRREIGRLYGEFRKTFPEDKPKPGRDRAFVPPRFEPTAANAAIMKGSADYARAAIAQKERPVELRYFKAMTEYLKRIAEREGSTVKFEEVGLR